MIVSHTQCVKNFGDPWRKDGIVPDAFNLALIGTFPTLSRCYVMQIVFSGPNPFRVREPFRETGSVL